MTSSVDHPRPSAEGEEPPAKHLKDLPSDVVEDGSRETEAIAPLETQNAATVAVAEDSLMVDSGIEEEGQQQDNASVEKQAKTLQSCTVRHKTSLCSYFRKGGCRHAEACRYAHGEHELQQRPDGSWDPTSEKAKKLEREKQILERMLMANTAKAEEGRDDSAEFASGLTRKCVTNLPSTWNVDTFKDFLEKNNIRYSEAKKKKGMSVGFLGFENADQVLAAIQAAENLTVHGKKVAIVDAHPRAWEKKTNACEDTMAVDGNPENSTFLQMEDESSGKRVRDICDAVTPLAKTPYLEQLRLKKEALAQVLKRLARNTRKSCAAGVLLPDWILAARELDGLPCELQEIIASPLIDGYRNKCEFSIGSSADGRRIVGFQLGNFREGITAIAEPSSCTNVSEIAKVFTASLQRFVEDSDLPVWNKHNNTGFWRMLTVREGRAKKNRSSTGIPPVLEVMLIVQVCPVGIPRERLTLEYKKMAKAFSNSASEAKPSIPITALLIQEHIGISNAAPADCPLICLPIPDPMSGGADEEAGNKSLVGHIHDHILDLRFQISPTAFFQVNTLAAERLYSLAGDWAQLGPDTLLFDVCCGTGTIGLTLAHRVGLVVGIEMNPSAVADAWTNAKINNIKNCEFVTGKAEDVIKGLLEKYALLPASVPNNSLDNVSEDHQQTLDADNSVTSSLSSTKEVLDAANESSSTAAEACVLVQDKAGEKDSSQTNGSGCRKFKNIVVIVDPPRSGLHPVVSRTLRLHAELQRIVYISCNPETLMANAVELCTPLDGSSSAENAKGNKSRRNMRGTTSASQARQRVKSMPDSKPFKPVKAVGVDMFPHTRHCEMLMLFER